MYCVLRYISQPHSSQHPQSHSTSLEPGDGHRTIPSNGKLLPEHSATSTFDHLRYITYGIFWRVFDKQMHMIRVYCHINNLNVKFLTGLPDYRFSQHSHIAHPTTFPHPASWQSPSQPHPHPYAPAGWPDSTISS